MSHNQLAGDWRFIMKLSARKRQKELFLTFLPQWQKLSTEDICSLISVLFIYFVMRLKGYGI